MIELGWRRPLRDPNSQLGDTKYRAYGMEVNPKGSKAEGIGISRYGR